MQANGIDFKRAEAGKMPVDKRTFDLSIDLYVADCLVNN